MKELPQFTILPAATNKFCLVLASLFVGSIAATHVVQAAAQPSQIQTLSEAARKGGADATAAQSLAQAVTATLNERTKLTPPNGAVAFGFSVSLSGNRALVGSISTTTTGAAYVYVFDGTTWTLEATLTASDGATNDAFGSAVSLSGNRALIGAPSDFGTSRPGATFVFAFDGTTWNEEAKLTPSGSATNDYFGVSVSL